MNNKTYDFMKRLVTVVMPAFATLYLGLDAVVGVPAPEKVVGVIALLATFLGVSLNISSNKYEPPVDGDMIVIPREDGGLTYSLEIDGSIEDLQHQDVITFRPKRVE